MAENNAGTIAKAYVQVMPSMKGIKEALRKGMDADNVGKSAGQSIASKIKGAIAAIGIGVAVKKVLGEAFSEGAKLQQSYLGGVDTLYADAADNVRAMAKEAAAFGISMNDYSEQAVSFGAALKQAYGGDVVKAAEAADIAIKDMADNSAKMGTDIGAIQAAYQGFAKGNYTMLDNLKLGYGGTKTEMEKLLKDATKLSGIKYNLDNLGDVYSAIHVIQENLKLTGVAAEEAKGTFSGSLGAMKAAASNFFGALALGQDVEGSLSVLIESAKTFLIDNAIPMAGEIFNSIGTAMIAMKPYVIEFAKNIPDWLKEQLPEFLNAGAEAIDSFISGMTGSDTTIASDVLNGISNAFSAVSDSVSKLIEAYNNLSPEMKDFIAQAAGILLVAAPIIGIGTKVLPLITTIGGGIFSLIGGIGGLGGKLGSLIGNVTGLSSPLTGIGNALGVLTKNALGLVAAGAGILMAAAGFALLAHSAIQLVNAGPMAGIALAGMVAGIATLAAGAALAAPALTTGAAGLIAFGAGVALVGAGVLMATAGMALLATQLPMITTFGVPAASAIMKISTALIVFAPSAALSAASLVAFGVGAAGAAIGTAALALALAPVSLEMLSISGSATESASALEEMVSSIDIVSAGLDSLKALAGDMLDAFVSAFSNKTPTTTQAVLKFMEQFNITMQSQFILFQQQTELNLKLMDATILAGLMKIYMTISTMMDQALAKIKQSLLEMQQAFANTEFKFSQNIVLPHFSMSGAFDAVTGEVPSVSVNWYANGGILTAPIIFGMGKNGLLGGGEAGAEAVLPIEKLKDYMHEVLDERDNSSGSRGGFSQTVNIYSPRELSPSEIARRTRNEGRQLILKLRGHN